jgi:hypothetical protein
MIVEKIRRRVGLLGIAAVALAAAVTVFSVPVTSAQGTAVTVLEASGALPVGDPFDPAWDAIRPVDVPLSGQAIVPPMLVSPSVGSVRVRALKDSARLAVLLEWSDASMNDSVLTPNSFADQAAIQFGLGLGSAICMGMQAGGLNIWHWKADWAADQAGYRDVDAAHPNEPTDPHAPQAASQTVTPNDLGPDGFFSARMAGNPRSMLDRPSSVEDLNAIGFGSLTPQPRVEQEVRGASTWRDGTWRVVFSRALAPTDPNDAQFGQTTAVTSAFAIWDGAHGDRDGLKSVSGWMTLLLPAQPMTLLDEGPLLVMILMAIGLALAVLYIGVRQPTLPWHGPTQE